MATVQLHNARRNPVQKRPVVGDHDHAAFELNQQVFQPLDAVEIQMVGRLIEQQNIWQGHQSLTQRDAFTHAARQAGNTGLTIQMQTVHRFNHALFPIPPVL